MDENTVIKVDGLYKKFSRSIKRSMIYGSADIAKSMLGISPNTGKLRKGEFWALEDISFELKKGEALGIIGINGSGKSTLLRLLTGIFPPDKGKIQINGTIGSLIAVGAGFHPHMTGRENVYLNGTILGMTKGEIDEKFQSIIDFADIGDFIDAPVSTYSSGMRVRLGFAIAIKGKPDILLIDEILSVGDLSFRNKSLRQMAEYRRNAKALIFVSHDMEQIRNLCDKVILIDKGKVVFNGDVTKGVVMFEELTRDIRLKTLKKEGELNKVMNTFDTEAITIKEAGLLSEENKSIIELELGSSLKAFIDFEVKQMIESLSINLPIVRDDNLDVYCINAFSDINIRFENLKPGNYKAVLKLEKHNLNAGVYKFGTLTFRNNKTLETFIKSKIDFVFKVKSDGKTYERGFIDTNQEWSLINE